jgi:hypothetical protein
VSGEEAADGVNLAADLEGWLLDENVRASLSRLKPDQETMDGGSIIGVILAAPAVIELAKALQTWIKANRSAKITIKDGSGQVIVENLSHAELRDVVSALSIRLSSA